MKAIICTKYGSPEVLQLKEVQKPVPKDHEILVKVHASSVTSGDCRIRSFNFAPWFNPFGRLIYGFRKPRKNIPGDELAGEIEAVGKEVILFEKGDQVFGMSSKFGFGGANAEYICLPKNRIVAHKPAKMTYEEAAAVPWGGVTAFHFLNKAGIQAGDRVLIYGASGSVGTYAVQLAKYLGAKVTAVCSTSNLELVKSLGADDLIDYTKEDFTKNGKRYDAIFDTVIKTTYSRCKRSLKPGGKYITVDWPLLEALGSYIRGKNKIIFGIPPTGSDILIQLKKIIEDGKIRAVIDRSYPLEQIADAHSYVDLGHKKGNVVINLMQNTKKLEK